MPDEEIERMSLPTKAMVALFGMNMIFAQTLVSSPHLTRLTFISLTSFSIALPSLCASVGIREWLRITKTALPEKYRAWYCIIDTISYLASCVGIICILSNVSVLVGGSFFAVSVIAGITFGTMICHTDSIKKHPSTCRFVQKVEAINHRKSALK